MSDEVKAKLHDSIEVSNAINGKQLKVEIPMSEANEVDGVIMCGDAPDLRTELCELLNRYSRENISNTPDFILRDYLFDCLKAFERGVQLRDEFRSDGRKH